MKLLHIICILYCGPLFGAAVSSRVHPMPSGSSSATSSLSGGESSLASGASSSRLSPSASDACAHVERPAIVITGVPAETVAQSSAPLEDRLPERRQVFLVPNPSLPGDYVYPSSTYEPLVARVQKRCEELATRQAELQAAFNQQHEDFDEKIAMFNQYLRIAHQNLTQQKLTDFMGMTKVHLSESTCNRLANIFAQNTKSRSITLSDLFSKAYKQSEDEECAQETSELASFVSVKSCTPGYPSVTAETRLRWACEDKVRFTKDFERGLRCVASELQDAQKSLKRLKASLAQARTIEAAQRAEVERATV